MGTVSRQVVIGALVALGLACVAETASAQNSAASAPGPRGSRIRTHSAIVRALIYEASERPGTFRALVAAIEASDGLVYLNVGTCGRVRACLLHQMMVSGPHRVLNIIVDVRRDGLGLAAAIGHELQHAVEVLSDTRIRTDVDIFAFYTLHGLEMRGVMETRAAVAVGDAVRDEVRR